MTEPLITPEIIETHGLSEEEYKRILELIGRSPSFTELGIFSAMWNEHCSYKSSKKWLRTLPTTGSQVICGPGENAGVVDIGDGQAVVFKMESHNHPSYIEPYQGAATGMGGILRDVFTMGARPIATMNSLSFGAPAHPKTKTLVSGVVAGIGGYGNCFGVPTVGGEIRFDTEVTAMSYMTFSHTLCRSSKRLENYFIDITRTMFNELFVSIRHYRPK